MTRSVAVHQTSRAAAGTSRPRRLLFGLLLSMLIATVAVAPARAQDDPATADGAGPGLALDLASLPSQDEAPATEAPPPAEPEPEPATEEVVDNGDRSIQILEHDVSAYPSVDVVISVPPALEGELQQGSFSLTENGRVRSLDVVKLRDVLEVVVVIDTSGSMSGDPIEAATAAAKDFVRSLDADTRIAVVGFGATAETKADFGSTREEIDAAIDGLSADGETTLYDSLVLASSEFGDDGARRFVVVLSDGKDTASVATLADAGAALQAAESNMYAITLQSADADFAGLETLAEQVNGQVVGASDASSLSSTFSAVASRLTNQYRLSYRSTLPGLVAVAIAVDAKGILAVAAENLQLTDDVDPGPSTTDVTPDPVTGEVPRTSAVIDTSNPETFPATGSGGLTGSANAIYIGAGALFLGVAAAVFMAMSTNPQGPSAFERLNFTPGAKRGGLSNIADRASGMADRMLEKQSRRGALDESLERAGLDMRPGEYVMTVAAIAVVGGILAAVMMSPLVGLAAFVVSLVGGRSYVNFRASKRQKLFGNQLGDTLMMIAGSIRAGHGVAEAIDTVASQAEAPTGEEFSRAVAESRIGRDMVDSLYDIADRTASEDFIWVVRAIGINRELGGDLAEILDNVGETIRDRNRLRDQVKALSAEGKVSAMILFALPICVGGWVQMSNPDYLKAMTDETAGKGLMAGAFMSLVIGGIWLKKLVNVDF